MAEQDHDHGARREDTTAQAAQEERVKLARLAELGRKYIQKFAVQQADE